MDNQKFNIFLRLSLLAILLLTVSTIWVERVCLSLFFYEISWSFTNPATSKESVEKLVKPKDTEFQKTVPTSMTQKASDLSIERVYLKDCRIHVLIKNIGSAGISDEDYQSGELLVLIKKPDGTFEKTPLKLKM